MAAGAMLTLYGVVLDAAGGVFVFVFAGPELVGAAFMFEAGAFEAVVSALEGVEPAGEPSSGVAEEQPPRMRSASGATNEDLGKP
jgi:hypothetical protein